MPSLTRRTLCSQHTSAILLAVAGQCLVAIGMPAFMVCRGNEVRSTRDCAAGVCSCSLMKRAAKRCCCSTPTPKAQAPVETTGEKPRKSSCCAKKPKAEFPTDSSALNPCSCTPTDDADFLAPEIAPPALKTRLAADDPFTATLRPLHERLCSLSSSPADPPPRS